MKPPPFDYVAPRSLDEALALLAEHGEDGKVLAGGQSLIPLLNFRLARPSVLIDVNRVPGLAAIRRKDGQLSIGALVRQCGLEHSPLVAADWPLLRQAVRLVAHPQIRNAGTVGGSLAHADPSAELPCAAAALGACFVLRSSSGSRTVSWQEFFRSPLETCLLPAELLVEILIPPLPPGARTSFTEFARRHGDFALGGAAVVLGSADGQTCDHAAIALLAAGGTPARAEAAEAIVTGRRLADVPVEEVAEAAVAGIAPTGDMHGDTNYRRRLIRSLVARALSDALARGGRRAAA